MDSYLLVLLPPDGVISEVNQYRKKYAKHTSYVIPPHITIFPPFFLKNITERKLQAKLRKDFYKIQHKKILLNSIGYFEGKNNVAYVKPDANSSKYIIGLMVTALESLKVCSKNVYDDYSLAPEKFNPHMTIAEKIPDDTLALVKQQLKKFRDSFSFEVSSIFVYKEVDNTGVWNKLEEIAFNQ